MVYDPDPACAAALATAKTPDEKRDVLAAHGFACTQKKTKSGARWEYQKGDGKAATSLAALVRELSAPPAEPAALTHASAASSGCAARITPGQTALPAATTGVTCVIKQRRRAGTHTAG